jgi:hypothetical protein
MAWRHRNLQGPEERRALKLPIPPVLSHSTLELTVLEEQFRVAAIVQSLA